MTTAAPPRGLARRSASLANHLLRTIAIGAASSLACVGLRLFFRGLQWIFTQNAGLLPVAAASLSPVRRALTPVAGAACAMLVLWMIRKRTRQIEHYEYVEAIRFHDGRIPFLGTIWRTIFSAFSIGTGASIGREGPMIQFADSVCSWMGKHAPLRNVSLARQVAYGTAAAVATAYQAPIAGVFFVTEIVLGEMVWADLPFLAVASGTGYLVSHTIFNVGHIFQAGASLPLRELSWLDWLCMLPLAALLGAAGPLYQKSLRVFRFVEKWPAALMWAGLVVGLCSILRPAVWGNADVALLTLLHQPMTLASLGILVGLRLFCTSFCVGAGTAGGVFTPTLLAGAGVGLTVAHFTHAGQPVAFAIIGLGCLLAATTHAPLMASFMAVELTGCWKLFPAVLLCNFMAFHVAKRISPRSLFAIATPEPLHETGE